MGAICEFTLSSSSKSTNTTAPSASSLREGDFMEIRLGYELNYTFPQATPMILALSIHYSRASDIVVPDSLTTDPPVPIGGYRDGFASQASWDSRSVSQYRLESHDLRLL